MNIKNSFQDDSPRKCIISLDTTTVLSFGTWYNFFEPVGNCMMSFENGSLRDLYKMPLSPID
jgi:hypothetical protein